MSAVIVAAVQMCSVDEVATNLDVAERLLRQAAERGALLAVLPENFALMGRRDTDKLAAAEDQGAGPIQQRLASLAARLQMWIIGGTIPLRIPGDRRVAAASLVFDSSGAQVARYDKMHLFDVDLPGKAESHRESTNIAPGAAPVLVDTPVGRIGLSVCYDMRFPELYRAMSADGAVGFVMPAAFTVPTGRAHWEVLLRARAIENLAWVIAPGQTGTHPSGRKTYGDSLIVDHWGTVLARLPEGEGVVTATLDLQAQRQSREEFPALTHRRL